jgi:DNA-binding NtrC family response regulator
VTSTILLVDAPPSLARQLEESAFCVELTTSIDEAHARIAELDPELLLVSFPRTGVEQLRELRERWPELVCVAHLSESAGLAGTAEALRAGALDVISGSAPQVELQARLEKAREVARLRRSLTCLRAIEERGRAAELCGQSAALQLIRRQIRDAGASDHPVLIVGETGTGKGLVARAIQRASARRERPLVIASCAAGSVQLEELFGRSGSPGLFEAADGGTLLLDEIGDLEPATQQRVLEAVRERRVQRGGALVEVDVRVLATSSRDLARLAATGRLRSDLLRELAARTIYVPPLRERRDDIPLLVGHCLAQIGASLGAEVGGVEPRALALLAAHPLPGNVRQLRNLIEQAVHLARGHAITAELIDLQAVVPEAPSLSDALATVQRRGAELLAEEARLVNTALRRVDGNKTRAAALLRISRYALQRKLRRLSRGESADAEALQ